MAREDDYAGKVLLIVNVASGCDYTGQYVGPQTLHRKFKERGLIVMGCPCSPFGKQEPVSNSEIAEFCSSDFSVTFPMFAKVEVGETSTRSARSSPARIRHDSISIPTPKQGWIKLPVAGDVQAAVV